MIIKQCGIYKILNIITKDYYLGSSSNIQKRAYRHRNELASNTCPNSHLQNAWNKYGADNFEFSTILLCDVEHKLYFEQGFIDLFKPAYNKAQNATASFQGLHHTEETKRKMS